MAGVSVAAYGVYNFPEIFYVKNMNEERPWVVYQTCATIGELTLSMQQYPVQQGTLFTINYHIRAVVWVDLQNNAGSAGVKG